MNAAERTKDCRLCFPIDALPLISVSNEKTSASQWKLRFSYVCFVLRTTG